MYRIAVTDNLTTFKDMADEWNDLLSRSVASSIFLTWEWLYTWSEHFLGNDRKLFVLSLYEDEKLIAIAPWCVRMIGRMPQIRQIEFLGSPDMGSDYLDVFAMRGKEKEASLRFYAFLFGEAESFWNSFKLTEMRAESLFLLHFTEQLKVKGKYFSLADSAYCPLVRLPGSWPDFLDSLSPHRRKAFARDLKVLQRDPSTRYETVPFAHSDNGLSRFFALYRSLAPARDETFYAHLTRFVERCAGKPWIEADFLNVDGKDVAAFLHFRYRGNIFLYSMVVNKEFNSKISIGNVLVGLCLERAISQAVPVYDFLKGTEDYKFYWAETGSRLLALSLYRKHVSSVGALLCSMAKDIGRVVLR